MTMGGHSTWRGQQTVQYKGGMLWNCAPETYMTLLTNVTAINSMETKHTHTHTKQQHLNTSQSGCSDTKTQRKGACWVQRERKTNDGQKTVPQLLQMLREKMENTEFYIQ